MSELEIRAIITNKSIILNKIMFIQIKLVVKSLQMTKILDNYHRLLALDRLEDYIKFKLSHWRHQIRIFSFWMGRIIYRFKTFQATKLINRWLLMNPKFQIKILTISQLKLVLLNNKNLLLKTRIWVVHVLNLLINLAKFKTIPTDKYQIWFFKVPIIILIIH